MVSEIEFICPGSVSAGDLVMDPDTGSWGFAKKAYSGGDRGVFSTGGGYLIEISGKINQGGYLYLNNGVISPIPNNKPCCFVSMVLSENEDIKTVMITLL